ncbi:MAG: DEAD/DEAH box helicase family protein [Candidatus Paceibacterota bacterium]
MFPLKPFQETAIAKLKDQFLDLWKSSSTKLPLVFKSPTGSGKTVMLAQFLRDIISDPRFVGNDVAFLWMSKGPTLVEQSKSKLFEYYGGASELELLDINDLNRKVMTRNSVFFINWEKLKGQSKEVLKIRKDNEQDISFDGMIDSTHEENRKIVVIIDEEHLGADTEKALELIDGLIKPKIIIRTSATPKFEPTLSDLEDKTAGFVRVRREDVIKEGLIKEKIIFQTEEDLNQKQFKGMDQDEILLELAYQKREELLKYYKELNLDINPLVLIQLPNDDKATTETSNTNKQEIVTNYLKKKGVSENNIAVWLSEDKINLEDVERSNSSISFLLFKQAVATGWDCPRAGVLVMFREIKNPTFAIQTVGRILRMPLGTHFGKPELNLGYLYTNYKRNEVISEYDKSKSENKPAIYGSYRRKDVEAIQIESVFMSRSDYNDLGDTFQTTFKKIANKAFGIKENDSETKKKLVAKGLELKPQVTNGIIVGVEIDDYDNFTKELLAEGGSHDQEMSQHDIERLYNLVCFNIVGKQTDENKKFAPERSWGKLKTALNVWLLPVLGDDRTHSYKVILNDLLKEGGVLRPIIGEVLETYRPIRDQEVNKKSARSKRTEIIEIPRSSLFFTDNYEEMKVRRSAMEPFYIAKEVVDNEKSFIKLLDENKNVEWWYKNGDSGSEYFSISYYNADENKEKLFYPDWIIKTKNKVWIVDTKAGFTAESNDTKYKAEALQEWLKGKKGFAGGIAVKDVNGWKINSSKEYSYTPVMKGWDSFEL